MAFSCPVQAAVSADSSNVEDSYSAAKDHYYKLERDQEYGKARKNWLNGVRQFRKIYLQQTKGPYAPSALYMMGRMQKKMYEQFAHPIDLEDSLNYFSDVATIFPTNKLADDALYNCGQIYLASKHNAQKAADQFVQIINKYPQGDKYAQAINQIQKLHKTQHVSIPETLGEPQSKEKLVNVLPVQYWSSESYTRVVIRASGPVQYSSDLLEKNSSNPRRLYIDFHQSYIPPKFRSPVPIQDGLLQQVRSGQYDQDTVRVVLDIESISDYKIFSLSDPFRVVVDVHGKNVNHSSLLAKKNYSNTPRIVQKDKKRSIRPNTPSGHSFVTLKDDKKRSADTFTSQNNTNNYSLAQQLGLGVRKIIIDPGHGGKDPGATAYGIQEKDLVLSIAKKLAYVLSTSHGYETLLTRTTDTFIPLEERTAIANTQNADLFISIHVNAHPDKTIGGLETYYLNLATNAEAMRVAALENATSTHNISEMQDILTDLMKNSKINESSRLAQYVHTHLVSGTQARYMMKDLGVKQAPFYVLIGAEMPAILTEISFITNPQEAKLLQTSSYQTTIAQQIAAGIISYIDHHTSAALLPKNQ